MDEQAEGTATYATVRSEPGRTARDAPAAMDRFAAANHYLHDRLDLLHNRLGSVLGPEFPAEVALETPPSSDIESQIGRIEQAAGRIDNILARLVL